MNRDRMLAAMIRRFISIFVLLALVQTSPARIGIEYQMQLGNPSDYATVGNFALAIVVSSKAAM